MFVGLTLRFDDIKHIGYYLDTPLDTNYRSVNKRTLNDIVSSQHDLNKIFLETENPNIADLMTLYKCKIRKKFPVSYTDVIMSSEYLKRYATEQKYKILSANEILSELNVLLTPLITINNQSKKNKHTIIHVSGSQGSGKTHLGDKVKLYYGDLIHVKDLDNLYYEFIQTDGTNYQMYVDNFIIKHKNKPILFVGLDSDVCLGPQTHKSKETTLDVSVHAKHKFFINIDDDKILRQRFNRQIQKLYNNRDEFFDLWQKDPSNAQEKLIRYINLDDWKDNNVECQKIYIKKNYESLSYEEIFEKIKEILINDL